MATADITAARKLNVASATLAFSVLADSAIEHYRAMFFNPAMYMPLLAASASLAVGAHGFGDPRRGRHRVRNTVYVAAAATGLAGTGFHIYNVAVRREGGVNWQNLFYGAPVGAPFALLLSGLLGAVAEEVRDAPRGAPPKVAGVRAGRSCRQLRRSVCWAPRRRRRSCISVALSTTLSCWSPLPFRRWPLRFWGALRRSRAPPIGGSPAGGCA
ncbi:MAG: hypothetical protein EKK41_02135 [Hyphomicrobiales bacterium]|nr:MAG: hypothetical protein EKK41_02135 [Hyphomicrobiales bacterium]